MRPPDSILQKAREEIRYHEEHLPMLKEELREKKERRNRLEEEYKNHIYSMNLEIQSVMEEINERTSQLRALSVWMNFIDREND